MKKKLLVGVAALCGAVAVFAAPFVSGWGWSGSVGTNTVYKTGIAVNSLSVKNLSMTEPVFALVNCASNALATAVTAGTAVPIPTNSTFTFNMQAHGQIDSLALAATNSTVTVFVGGL